MSGVVFLLDDFKNIIKVACIYMSTIIGAGFASGQEIVQFFSTYYKGGFYGIIFAGLMFSIIGYVVLEKVYRERIRNYDEFIFPAVGWFMGWIMEIVVSIFMASVFCIMIAGMGNVVADKMQVSLQTAVIIISVLCMLVLLTDIKGVVAVSTVLTPILIVGIISVGLYIIIYKDTSVVSFPGGLGKITDNWFFSALVYVSYNSIMSVVVMTSLLPYLKTRKVAVAGGVLGGAFLCIIAFILNFAIYLFYPDVVSSQIPVLSIVNQYNGTISGLYSIILLLAMFVSAVTSGYCFVGRVSSKANIDKRLMALILCVLAIPMSSYGFSGLIATIYPFFGYVGMFMIFVILIQGMRAAPAMMGRKRR